MLISIHMLGIHRTWLYYRYCRYFINVHVPHIARLQYTGQVGCPQTRILHRVGVDRSQYEDFYYIMTWAYNRLSYTASYFTIPAIPHHELKNFKGHITVHYNIGYYLLTRLCARCISCIRRLVAFFFCFIIQRAKIIRNKYVIKQIMDLKCNHFQTIIKLIVLK